MGIKKKNIFITEDNLENNLNQYKNSIVKFRGFIPIEEFEYYLLAD